ncbi:MAG TPA: MarR family transcriptional regulator [Steroidobacteraceae bacterium]|jgi:MarR family transcriptional regulator for hemolysin
MSELEERFADALHATARVWRQAIDRRLKSLGMSQASWMTIAVASKARAPLSQSELADRLGVEGATMVAMVDRLAKAGFVARHPCQSDRRVNRVVLTEEGNRLIETVKTEAAAVRKELLGNIDAAKLAVATELLETLQEMIERSGVTRGG